MAGEPQRPGGPSVSVPARTLPSVPPAIRVKCENGLPVSESVRAGPSVSVPTVARARPSVSPAIKCENGLFKVMISVGVSASRAVGVSASRACQSP